MFRIVPEGINIDFMSGRKVAAMISAVLVVIAVSATAIIGPKYGIDFAGGVEIQIKLDGGSITELRSALEASGIGSFQVQSYGEDGTQFLARVNHPDDMDLKEIVQRVETALDNAYSDQYLIERQEFVGPKAGAELREKGMMAVLFSLIGILIYISLRFELSFAYGAVAALFHDVMIVCGLFIILGHEFSLQTVAALLTIVGYSLNDTIVVFDRIRENIGRKSKSNLVTVLNISINETLSRTILTSITTLFTVSALYFIAAEGSVIKDFAFALLIGIIAGTYSSIYVASPVVIAYENRKSRKS